MQALQAQLLQHLAVNGGTASLAHISELTQQNVVGCNGLRHGVQSMQPSVSISVTSPQQLMTPPAGGKTSVQQQAFNGDFSINSSVSWCDNASAHASQPSQVVTESSGTSEAVLSPSLSVNELQFSQAESDASVSYSLSQPAHISQLQAIHTADQHNSSQDLSSLTQSQPINHSRVIEQLQQQLLESLTKQSVNGCEATVTADSLSLKASCKVEAGEVDSNELMQFLA